MSNPVSPIKKRIALEPRNELLNQSVSDSVIQSSQEKVKKRIFQMNPKAIAGDSENQIKQNDTENSFNVSMSTDTQ